MAHHRTVKHRLPSHRARHRRQRRIRRRTLGWLSTLPVLVGAAALILAAAGGARTGGRALVSGDTPKWSAATSVLNGSSQVGREDTVLARQHALSRDSERQALADAAGQPLRPAAGAQGRQRHAALAKLAASAQRQANKMALNAWQLPIAPGSYRLTARFGECFGLWVHCHTGLDFAAPTGTPIHAVATGLITKTGWAGPYGYRTEETLPDGTQLWYCHQNFIPVHDGLHVVAGQVIGRVGSTGNTTGPHLHLEVRPGGGDPVDPYAALVAHGLSP